MHLICEEPWPENDFEKHPVFVFFLLLSLQLNLRLSLLNACRHLQVQKRKEKEENVKGRKIKAKTSMYVHYIQTRPSSCPCDTGD